MQLTPEQVNDFIANAVLESQLGVAVKESVDRAVRDLSRGYDNPFDKVIRQFVENLISSELRENYLPRIADEVKQTMENYVTDEIVQKIVEAGMEKLRSRY